MNEVGADTGPAAKFIESVQQQGILEALELPVIPSPSREFSSTTFQFTEGDKPHEVAAALALGREHIIPGMFRSILKKIGVSEHDAPIFHFYLNRHIHLDEDFHAPLPLRLLNSLCANDESKLEEAIAAANRAVEARLRFWDGVQVAIAQADTST